MLFGSALQCKGVVIAKARFSIYRNAHHFNAHPQRIKFVALTLAEMIILVTAFLVVKTKPHLFLILGQLDLKRLARR